MAVRSEFEAWKPEIASWRQHIHSNPELMFDTVETAAFVKSKLEEMGVDEIVTGIAKNGLVAVIKGAQGEDGLGIGLRADMDALPIHEQTNLPYASKNEGKMHACGHDGHTAMLLGVAKYFSQNRDFKGKIILIFQPAEEGGGGGRVMVEEGIMDRFGVTEVYGQHNWPGKDIGVFATRPGPMLASTAQFDIEITGTGGHASQPHKGVDPLMVSAYLTTAMQTIVSRNHNTVDELVVSVTAIECSSTAYNVIPKVVKMKGTVRTMDTDLQEMAEERIRALATSIASGFGATAEVRYKMGYPALVNTENEAEYAKMAASAVAGDCELAPKVMGGEDFAYMTQARPGAFMMTGNGDSAQLHTPEYNFNDDAIPYGCSWMVEIAEQRLNRF